MANVDDERERRNQLINLGNFRRNEIATAMDDRERTPYIGYNKHELEALRSSVQNARMAQTQKENQPHLAAWSDFHKSVEDVEKEPTLMDGQSHRARLHFDMRDKGVKISDPARTMPRNASVSTSTRSKQSSTSLLDPALDHSMPPPKAPSRQRTPTSAFVQQKPPPRAPPQQSVKSLLDLALGHSNPPPKAPGQSAKSLLDPALGHPDPSKGIQIKGRAAKIQRRPASRSPLSPNDYVGNLVDPSTWLEDARRTTQPVTPQKSDKVSRPHTPQSVAAMQPTTSLEKQVLKSNLPQPQTSNSTSYSRTQSKHDSSEDLLLDLETSPEKSQLGASATASKEIDNAENTENTGAKYTPSHYDNVIMWFEELGLIDKALFANFSDESKKQVLKERKKQIYEQLHAILPKTDHPQTLKEQENQTESTASGSPLQKSVKAKPFVPLSKSVSLGASVRGPLSLETSRHAPSKINAYEKNDEPKEIADSSTTYWQKTLPKRIYSKQNENELIAQTAPLAIPKQQSENSSASKTELTKSLYESRYAC